MEKDYSIIQLADIYGALLTERQRDILRQYYDFDSSLAEIAEVCQITRQSVRDALVSAAEQLRGYEEKLGFSAKMEALKAEISEIQAQIGKKSDCELSVLCEALIARVEE